MFPRTNVGNIITRKINSLIFGNITVEFSDLAESIKLSRFYCKTPNYSSRTRRQIPMCSNFSEIKYVILKFTLTKKYSESFSKYLVIFKF